METYLFLKECGFTEYETKVYLALASLGTTTAREIIKCSSVPSNKVYESLISLVEQGFVGSLNLSPKQYKILGVGKFQEIIKDQENNLKKLYHGIKSLEKNILLNVNQTSDFATVFKGKNKIMQMLNEITPKLQHFQYNLGGNLIFSPTAARLVKEAIARGVEFRFLVHYEPSRKEVYEKWKKIGVKIRFYTKDEQKSIRFSTFDGKICRITIGKPQMSKEEDYLSFWIESPAFALLLKDQFLEMWKIAKESI